MENTHKTPQTLRKDIRSVCLAVAAFVGTITLFSLLFSVVYILVAMVSQGVFSQAVAQGQDSISSYINASDYQAQINSLLGLISCLSIIVGALWFFLIRGKRLVTSDLTKRSDRPTASMLLKLVILMFGIQFFMVLLNLLTTPLFDFFHISVTESMESATSSLFSTPFGIIYVVLVGPIFEEIAFRGAVMRKLEPYGANFAIVTSSILFGLYHIILFQAVFAFILGLVLAYTAGRYSLKWSIALHILNNLLAFLSTLSQAVAVVVIVLYLAGFIVSIILLATRRDDLRMQKRVGAPLFPRVFKTAYTTPLFIVFVAVFLVMGVLIL